MLSYNVSVFLVQSFSHVHLFAIPWTAAHHASLSFTIFRVLLKLMPIESEMLSNHLVLCHPHFLLSSLFPSIRAFSNELPLCIRWTTYWSFSFSISFSNEYSGLIAFMIDWLDLLAVQETLGSLLQHHSSKSSILQCSAFFMVQRTSIHDYWKNHIFDYVDFVSRVIFLLFNMLSRFVTAFLMMSNHLKISWLQSPCTVILEPRKIVFH